MRDIALALVRLWRERPRLLLMLRLVPARRRPGAPGAIRRLRRAKADRAVVTLHAPLAAAETIALVAARPRGDQRIRVEWPEGEPGFEDWHRAVIAAGALPYLDVE